MRTTQLAPSFLDLTFPRSHRLRFERLVPVLVGALVMVVWPAAGKAQDAADPNALIDQGVELRRAGDDEGALELFAQAWDAGHTPRARAQMALVEQALGHYVDAETHLLEALAVIDDPWIVLRRTDLAVALAAIQLRLGYLEVRGGVVGAEVRLDGRSVGTLPLDQPLRLAAGSYRMEVIAREHYPVSRQVTVVAEGTTRETIVMNATPPAPETVTVVTPRQPPPRSDVGSSGSVHPALGATLLGGSGVMLATSAITFGLRQRRATDYNSDDCLVEGETRGETCGSLYAGAVRAQRASATTLALGVGFAVAGTLMFILDPEANEDSAPPTAAVEVACGASFGAEWGAQCRLRF
jgi:hypothetical protein